MWRAASRRGIPVVHTLHDYYLLCPRSSMFRDKGLCEAQCGACRVFAMPRTWATRFVNAVTAPSHAVLDAHLSRGLFPTASTREVIQYVCPRPATIAEQPAIPGNVLGFIGRLTADKGLSQLLDWMAGTDSRRLQGLRLLIAGTGPLEAIARAAAARDDRIEVLGYTAPADFYPRITALAVPSIWNDPSPVVIREAYGYGIPVAGSRFGGIPELIRLVDDRLVFDPHDPSDMTRAIALALDPTGRPALQTACELATEQFTAARVCEQVEAVYRACMNAARR
ncbi:MAG: glycosyltransferase [Planctomycetia bacterium]|nr:glycosyltransferase [Planctomycetia bacterium]